MTGLLPPPPPPPGGNVGERSLVLFAFPGISGNYMKDSEHFTVDMINVMAVIHPLTSQPGTSVFEDWDISGCTLRPLSRHLSLRNNVYISLQSSGTASLLCNRQTRLIGQPYCSS